MLHIYFSQGKEDPTYPYIVFTVVGFIGIVSTSFGEILPRTYKTQYLNKHFEHVLVCCGFFTDTQAVGSS